MYDSPCNNLNIAYMCVWRLDRDEEDRKTSRKKHSALYLSTMQRPEYGLHVVMAGFAVEEDRKMGRI